MLGAVDDRPAPGELLDLDAGARDGADVWRRAMALRGAQEEEMVAVLSAREQAQLNRILKKLTLWTEAR